MHITTGLWLVAARIVALSFESLGAALVLFGIAGWLLSLDRQSEALRLPKMGPLSGPEIRELPESDFAKTDGLLMMMLALTLRCPCVGFGLAASVG